MYSVHLECAPVPVARDTGGYLRALGRGKHAGHHRGDRARDNGARRGARRVGALVATAAAAVTALPYLKFGKAVEAGASKGSSGVVVAVLVERDDFARVGAAEDVATAAAVMAAVEGIELALASRVVAHDGLGVGLLGFC